MNAANPTPPTFAQKAIPGLFAALTLLAYGLTLPQAGFFWDDWPFAWAAHFMGPASFIASFLRVRPFLGPIFLLSTSLLPETPFAWQAFALLMRLLLTLSAWWAMRSLWPQRPWQSLLVALGFLVYPAYSQHWVAFTHINQELIPFLFYILSFGASGLALRSAAGSRRRSVLALLLLCLGVFPTEYFISLEPLRFLFILFILSEQALGLKTLLLRAIKTWLPYLAVWSLNLAWLFAYYRSGVYANYEVAVTNLAPTPREILIDFVQASAAAVFKGGLVAWLQFPQLAANTLSAPSTWLALGAAALALAILLIFFAQLARSLPFLSAQTWAWQASLIGLVGIVLGRIPSWAADLPFTLQSSFDRFSISMMPGACLLLAGLLTLILPNKRSWMAAAALLIALGVGQQVFNANIFRRDWQRQRDIYWQLSWRVPAIQPGTILLTDTLEIDYETDYSLTAPINWIYAPDFHAGRLPYLVLSMAARTNWLPALEKNTEFQFAYRPVRFYGSTARVLAFSAPPNACLRILDPLYDDDSIADRLSPSQRQITRLSDPALILVDAPGPSLPLDVFGPQPAHDWCYYYAKSELARQQGDWQAILRLGQEAAQLGFEPSDALEWLPLLEAQTRTGQLDEADKLARRVVQARPLLRKRVCAIWGRAGLACP